MQASRRADSEAGAHEQPQIEPAHVHERALQNVRVAQQMRPSQAGRFIEVRVRPFQSLAATALQRAAGRARIHGRFA
jgi:hypothetical protein